MSEISPIATGSTGPIVPIHRNGYASTVELKAPSESASRRSDRVELSDHARLLDQMRRMPEVRTERIDAARAMIARGTYDDEGKLNQAMDRLLDDLEA